MNADPLLLDETLHAEADELLDRRGMRALLSQYGPVHVHGSYALRLMAWRDLDIYLENGDISESRFFELGARIVGLLQPFKMHFRNGRAHLVEDDLNGLYWGVYLGGERAGAWKIDIWTIGSEDCQRCLAYNQGIARRSTLETQRAIITIKSQCWQNPEYRRSYSSVDIYRAVLDDGVQDFDGFRALMRRGGVEIGGKDG
jgi:hypothetical protein